MPKQYGDKDLVGLGSSTKQLESGQGLFAAQIIVGPGGSLVTHPYRVLNDGVPGFWVEAVHNVLHRLCLHPKQLPIPGTFIVAVPYLRA